MIERATAYSWYVLILGFALMFFVAGFGYTIVPPLIATVLPGALGTTAGDLMMVWAMLPLAFVVFGILGGVAGDRWGIRWVVGIGTVLLCGLFGALRGVSPNLGTMMAMTFLYGIGMAVVFPNVPKAMGYFFPLKMLAIMVGVISAAFAIGGGVAMSWGISITMAWGGWENMFYIIGGITAGLGVLWFLTVRPPKLGMGPGTRAVERPKLAMGPGTPAMEMPGVMATLKKLLGMGRFWAVNGSVFANFGAMLLGMGFWPTFFAVQLMTAGIILDPVAAGMAGATYVGYLMWGLAAGMILVPMISDVVGWRRWFYIPALLIMALLAALSWIVFPGAGLAVVMVILGFLGGTVSLVLAHPVEHPDIGPLMAGTGTGLLISFAFLGVFVMSMATSASITAMNWTVPFVLMIILFAVAGLLYFFVKETGPKSRAA
jgi:MFS family permease